MDIQKTRLLNTQLKDISIQTEYNSNIKTKTYFKMEKIFEVCWTQIFLIILYISMGYIGYSFLFFFTYFIMPEYKLYTAIHQCTQLLSLCFFYQSFGMIALLILGLIGWEWIKTNYY
ncbi:hypothetical protein CPAV1605_1085 [seawater metagenome]|uniref:Uncharacterized protein n=1 Tax=seawater metagenome TaxID=1561972 RepID=A0A5E8CKS2_9ZZZZ